MKSENRAYLAGVDHLRAFAALLIFAYHALQVLSLIPRSNGDTSGLWIHSLNPLVALAEEGHTAVGLFMVLSGFIFTTGAHGRAILYGPFLRNRLLRILPMYIVLLFVGMAAYPAQFSMLGLLQSATFLGNQQGPLDLGAFSGMFWAIAVEFQFYLIFPFLHRFMEREGVRYGLLLIVLTNLLRFAATAIGTSNARDIGYWTILGRIDQFVLGMMTSRLYLRVHERRLPWGTLSIVATSAWPLRRSDPVALSRSDPPSDRVSAERRAQLGDGTASAVLTG